MTTPGLQGNDAIITSPAWAGNSKGPPLRNVLTQVAEFLEDMGYTKSVAALCKEAKKNDIDVDVNEWRQRPEIAVSLPKLWQNWQATNNGRFPTMIPAVEEEDSIDGVDDSDSESDEGGAAVDMDAEETSSDSSDEGSSSSSDEKSSAQPNRKRKRAPTPSSSESESTSEDSDSEPDSVDSDSSSSSDSDSNSDSDSDSSDDSVRPAKRTKLSNAGDSSSSESGSDSDSTSDSSDSSSDGEPAPPPPPSLDKKHKKSAPRTKISVDQKVNIPAIERTSSTTSSSVTIGAESPSKTEAENAEILLVPNTDGNMHPDRASRMPATKQTVKQLKKEQIPFSRIPVDTKVDPRFASNDYVSYDYADRAFRDLSVTKGKGFTKEKNKKKRGSYRGGAIDLTPKGIKFED